jgi:hypothetical protein
MKIWVAEDKTLSKLHFAFLRTLSIHLAIVISWYNFDGFFLFFYCLYDDYWRLILSLILEPIRLVKIHTSYSEHLRKTKKKIITLPYNNTRQDHTITTI